MKNKVLILLIMTLLTVAVIPLSVSIYLVRDVLISQQDIYRNPKLGSVLSEVQSQLKHFSKVNPHQESEYKELFQKIQEVKFVYGEDKFFSDRIRKTFSNYFFIIFGLSLIVALSLGLFLSIIINRIYKKSYEELEESRKKSTYLEEIARWQEIAQKLAHELRRPLQPITVWISNLKNSYKPNNEKFGPLLSEASSAIDEEVTHLKRMVDEFSKFANVPKAKMKSVNIESLVNEFTDQYSSVWGNASISVDSDLKNQSCQLDAMLFKQALSNMLENAVEANPNEKINVVLSLKNQDQHIALDFFNSGKTLTQDQQNKIFELYFSTKDSNKNMGLGMSIVKFAVLEHGGTIQCVAEDAGVRFRIMLPIAGGIHA